MRERPAAMRRSRERTNPADIRAQVQAACAAMTPVVDETAGAMKTFAEARAKLNRDIYDWLAARDAQRALQRLAAEGERP